MKSILAIIFTITLITAMILTTVRFWGMGQTFVEFPNEFFSEADKTFYVVPWDKTQNEKLILWANVFQNKEEQLMVSPQLSLLDLLQQRKNQRFILNLNENKDNIHKRITQVIETVGAEKRVLIQSDFHILLTSIKDQKPLYLYGASRSDIMRVRMYLSAFILPAIPYKGDVYISPLVLNKIPVFDQEVADEMKRRKKKVILGPLKSKEELVQAQSYSPDGYYVESEELIPVN